ncbi:MAG TPA: hypothetical protein VK254_00765 [Candidatus Bathyarchaeia archaeon]|nr:hypothetical protein [Candidatus Bathyarchaeia archaeon]
MEKKKPEVVAKGDRTHLVFKDDASLNAFAEKGVEALGDKFWDLVLALGDFNSQMTFATDEYQTHIAPLM